MCSIAGYTGEQVSGLLDYFVKAMVHRGPDDAGFFSDSHVHLCMTRLAIVDPAFGKQPVSSADGNVQLVFNGEIYNYLELRAELQLLGHTFATESDTEVLLEAYLEWGIDFIPRLNGMFAVSIYDREADKLYLMRDRIGEKPLYYSLMGESNELYFASEYNALSYCLRTAPLDSKHLDRESLAWYFSQKATPFERSIDSRIHKLPPASLLEYDLGSKSVRIESYYRIREAVSESLTSEEQLIDELEQLISDSVALRMRADVEVGTFLSGGVDSSLVSVLASRCSEHRLRTFSLVYDESVYRKQDDRDFARQIADSIDSVHTEVLLTPELLATELPKIVKHFGQPNCAVLANWFISREMGAQLKVALSGDGADELFGSYFLHRVGAGS